ncbi:MAG: diguanylate cyclase [Pirellulales bacterium]|nr:diguanylate cyclase [Pirellulales bacterium]
MTISSSFSSLSNALCDGNDARIEELTRALESVLLKVTGQRLPIASEPGLESKWGATRGWKRCFQVLRCIELGSSELHERLARLEALNNEQRLRLKASSLESQTDPITRLANRRQFDNQLDQRCLAAEHDLCPLAVIIFDIDHFKTINDTFGHQIGDAVLFKLSQLICNVLPVGAMLARFGGDEFAAILSGICFDQAIEIAAHVRDRVDRTKFTLHSQPVKISVSCGLAAYSAGEHRQQLVERSDLALYHSKQAGRNCASWHDGQEVHLITIPTNEAAHSPARNGNEPPARVIELSAEDDSAPHEISTQVLPAYVPRSQNTNWCDASTLYWFLQQRLNEWKRGGEPCCVLAIDVDNCTQLEQVYGSVALHFMMRAQTLHFDSVFRDMDVISRPSHAKVFVVLPRMTLALLPPILTRLRESMERFAYPTAAGLLEYSISLGATEVREFDDPQAILNRAEAGLLEAQNRGPANFLGVDAARTWNLEDDRVASPRLPLAADASGTDGAVTTSSPV